MKALKLAFVFIHCYTAFIMIRKIARNTVIRLWYNAFVENSKIDQTIFELIENYFEVISNYMIYLMYHNK